MLDAAALACFKPFPDFSPDPKLSVTGNFNLVCTHYEIPIGYKAWRRHFKEVFGRPPTYFDHFSDFDFDATQTLEEDVNSLAALKGWDEDDRASQIRSCCDSDRDYHVARLTRKTDKTSTPPVYLESLTGFKPDKGTTLAKDAERLAKMRGWGPEKYDEELKKIYEAEQKLFLCIEGWEDQDKPVKVPSMSSHLRESVDGINIDERGQRNLSTRTPRYFDQFADFRPNPNATLTENFKSLAGQRLWDDKKRNNEFRKYFEMKTESEGRFDSGSSQSRSAEARQ